MPVSVKMAVNTAKYRAAVSGEPSHAVHDRRAVDMRLGAQDAKRSGAKKSASIRPRNVGDYLRVRRALPGKRVPRRGTSVEAGSGGEPLSGKSQVEQRPKAEKHASEMVYRTMFSTYTESGVRCLRRVRAAAEAEISRAPAGVQRAGRAVHVKQISTEVFTFSSLMPSP